MCVLKEEGHIHSLPMVASYLSAKCYLHPTHRILPGGALRQGPLFKSGGMFELPTKILKGKKSYFAKCS